MIRLTLRAMVKIAEDVWWWWLASPAIALLLVWASGSPPMRFPAWW